MRAPFSEYSRQTLRRFCATRILTSTNRLRLRCRDMGRLGIPIELALLQHLCRRFSRRRISMHGNGHRRHHVRILCRHQHRNSMVLVVLGNHSLASPMVDSQCPIMCILVRCQTMVLHRRTCWRFRGICDEDWLRLVCRRTSTFHTIPKYCCHVGMDLCRWLLDVNTNRNWCHRLDMLSYRRSSKLAILKI